MSDKKIERVVVVDLRKSKEALEGKKPMIDGVVTQRGTDEKMLTLVLNTGYMLFLHFEKG